MTVFKSLCSTCQHEGGNGKVGWSGVEWTGDRGAGKVIRANCHVTLRESAGKTPSATIWQDLVTRAQSGQLSLTLEAEAGS